ncbi:MAG: hypothetical protein JJU29_12750 [Verrucomicrobia bacterium]|nr:hypothetical protein [Verrucomicrobiota bacterium]MCH8512634.1 hypothetical protein [Kiritimatiellia bacterium]
MSTSQNEQKIFEEIPVDLQETILLHLRRLPKGPDYSEFVRTLTRRTGQLVCDYRCTISYGLIGMILGEVIDQTLAFTLPEHLLIPKGIRGKLIQPTFGVMDKVFGVVGAWKGWKPDRLRHRQAASARKALRDFEVEFRKIIQEELAKYFANLSTSTFQPA